VPLRLLVLGTAVSGKWYLLGCLSQSLCGLCVVLARTGVPALNINGSTYHFFLRLGKTASCNVLCGPHLLEFQRTCASLRYILIDGLSMLGCRALVAVDQGLRQPRPDMSSVLLRGFSFILFGDLGQLPPLGTPRWPWPVSVCVQFKVMRATVRSRRLSFYLHRCDSLPMTLSVRGRRFLAGQLSTAVWTFRPPLRPGGFRTRRSSLPG